MVYVYIQAPFIFIVTRVDVIRHHEKKKLCTRLCFGIHRISLEGNVVNTMVKHANLCIENTTNYNY